MNAQQERLVFFGDSICVGQGVSIHKGWVARLAAHISEVAERNGRNILVINASVNGNTTRQALERMPYDVQSHGVQYMIIQFGMNDCNYWRTDRGVPRVSRNAFAANLVEIITRAFLFGARWIILNTNHPTTRTSEKFPFTDVTYAESNRAYNQIIREVARTQTERVILNDVEAYFEDLVRQGAVAGLDVLLLEDGLHLSEKGHQAYYQMIEPIIENLLAACYHPDLPQVPGAVQAGTDLMNR